jgi:hypothetical protein
VLKSDATEVATLRRDEALSVIEATSRSIGVARTALDPNATRTEINVERSMVNDVEQNCCIELLEDFVDILFGRL